MSDPIANDTEPVMLPGLTDEEGKTVLLLMLIASIASLIATVFGISLFFSIRYKYPRLVDRVTFRLVLATMISDFSLSIFQLLSSTIGSPTAPCELIMWGNTFFSLASIFFPTCIALNLQIMFIHEYRGRRKLEMFYYIGAISLAMILSLIPFADHMYGWDAPEYMCWFRESGTKLNIIWQWASFYSWEIICILYCLITLICVIVKLSRQSIRNNNTDGQTMTSRHDKNVLRNKSIMSLVVKRVIWYPIVPIITQAPNFLVETDIYVNQKINYVFLILAVFLSFQGFLNTIVFMQDIAVSRAYGLTKSNWWCNYVNKYEESYPHLSRNKAFYPLDSAEVKDEKQKQSQQQPSFGEKLRYNLLTVLFSKPKGDETLIEYDQYVTTRDDEELVSATQTMNEKSESDAKINDDEGTLDQFTKNVLCKL